MVGLCSKGNHKSQITRHKSIVYDLKTEICIFRQMDGL